MESLVGLMRKMVATPSVTVWAVLEGVYLGALIIFWPHEICWDARPMSFMEPFVPFLCLFPVPAVIGLLVDVLINIKKKPRDKGRLMHKIFDQTMIVALVLSLAAIPLDIIYGPNRACQGNLACRAISIVLFLPLVMVPLLIVLAMLIKESIHLWKE